LAAARRHLTTERTRHFEKLTLAWQMAAYAHRLPNDADAEALIESWRTSFESRPVSNANSEAAA
ncbi:MAG: hypothetical protein AAGM22_11395, partial [Acidobacteriota bacterium]